MEWIGADRNKRKYQLTDKPRSPENQLQAPPLVPTFAQTTNALVTLVQLMAQKAAEEDYRFSLTVQRRKINNEKGES